MALPIWPRFAIGEKRPKFGIRLALETAQPPGTRLASTTASVTPNSGSSILTSRMAAAPHTTDSAFSTSPVLPRGTNTMRNSARNDSR